MTSERLQQQSKILEDTVRDLAYRDKRALLTAGYAFLAAGSDADSIHDVLEGIENKAAVHAPKLLDGVVALVARAQDHIKRFYGLVQQLSRRYVPVTPEEEKCLAKCYRDAHVTADAFRESFLELMHVQEAPEGMLRENRNRTTTRRYLAPLHIRSLRDLPYQRKRSVERLELALNSAGIDMAEATLTFARLYDKAKGQFPIIMNSLVKIMDVAQEPVAQCFGFTGQIEKLYTTITRYEWEKMHTLLVATPVQPEAVREAVQCLLAARDPAANRKLPSSNASIKNGRYHGPAL